MSAAKIGMAIQAICTNETIYPVVAVPPTVPTMMETTTESPWPFHNFSPVTFWSDWSKSFRLVLVVCLTTYGSLSNLIFLSSILADRRLRRAGNAFLFFAGVTDMVVTLVIGPIIIVVLISGEGDNIHVCKILHFLGLASTYAYTLFYFAIAVDNYYRFTFQRKPYSKCAVKVIGSVCGLIVMTSSVLAYYGSFGGLDYDYCLRSHQGNPIFRFMTSSIMHLLPTAMIIFLLGSVRDFITKRAQRNTTYRRSKAWVHDTDTTHMNLTAFMFYITFWIPYLTISMEFPNTSNEMYYSTVAVGLVRSVLTSSIYGMFHKILNEVYAKLFFYSCFKTEMNKKMIKRHRRRMARSAQLTEVKVHSTRINQRVSTDDGPIYEL